MEIDLSLSVTIESVYKDIFEVYEKNQSLDEKLKAVIELLQQYYPTYILSILLIDKDLGTFQHSYSLLLPWEYNQALKGLAIGPGVGSCGTAAYEKKTVVVEDISTHPYWQDYLALAATANVNSCWSVPIFDSSQQVAATFAIYQAAACTPTDEDIVEMEQIANIIGVVINQYETQNKLEIASSVFEHCPTAVIVTDNQNNILQVNPAFERISGFKADEIIGQSPKVLASGQHPKAFFNEMWEQLLQIGFWTGEVVNKKKTGQLYNQLLQILAVHGQDGEVLRYVGFIQDVTEQKKVASKIYKQTNVDKVTGLYNRHAFIETLGLLTNLESTPDHNLAIVFIDLDLFKNINERNGHEYGDKVLNVVANRIKSSATSSDFIARIGGDEFTLITNAQSERLDNELKQLLHIVNQPIEMDGVIESVSASIGIAFFPEHAITAKACLNAAEIAMYWAKEAGRNCIKYYSADLQAEIQREKHLGLALKEAIKEGKLEIHYQPIFNKMGTRFSKAESLCRWVCEEHGFVSPVTFIPLAERLGLICQLSDCVLDAVLKELQYLESINQYIKISVNVSSIDLTDPSWAGRWIDKIGRAGINPVHLEIEVTESVFIDNQELVSSQLDKIRELGITIALDDFGTGFSSLSYLRNIQPHVIKVDRAFITNLENDIHNQTLVKAVVQIADVFNAKVVAEGVETDEQHELLADYGVNFLQGYLFSKPLPTDEFNHLVTS